MTEPTQRGIFLITTDFNNGLKRIREVIKELKCIGRPVETSTVYKRFRSIRSEDLNALIVVALTIELEITEFEIYEALHHLERNHRWSSTEILFLAAEKSLRLVPGENLPHPVLHTDSLALRCASEIMGTYVHPILGQNLIDLARSSHPVTQAEFFDQGKLLVSDLSY